MSCQNSDESCCCKITELTDLEKQILGLRISLNAIFSEDSTTRHIELSDPVSIRMYLMIDGAETRIMKKLREIEHQLLEIGLEQWKAEMRDAS
ncbi:hypothetical protein [Acidithiobacillus ferriphilus]|uniref:hypothetical protein n=1 Tax=Acidithiobacillus ferriphilus TaxID=1689834 RepID=UPI002DB70ACF|nr:hypothetical protein [Acidithiobacillus ferriphilus]MEB8476231.1 hypothetical protein [Acidithiobacillus ferriphilus]